MSRSIVVTGASTGIGHATVQRLARQGQRVFASVRREEDAAELVREGEGHVEPLVLDVTNRDQIEDAARTLEASLGAAGLGVLVNNAGIGFGGPMEFPDLDEMRHGFEVNVFGPAALTGALLPLLRRAQGRIVNVSSALAAVALPMLGPYCASKSALEALSDTLRLELRSAGVSVVLIEPGVIDTVMHAKTQADEATQWERLPPAGRELYAEAFRKRRESAERFRRGATPPEAVAKAIERAIRARRPRTRYPVGLDARGLVWMRKLLPDRAIDAIFNRIS